MLPGGSGGGFGGGSALNFSIVAFIAASMISRAFARSNTYRLIVASSFLVKRWRFIE